MTDQANVNQEYQPIKQPLSPEDVDPAQKQQQKEEIERRGSELTINPGDRINPNATLQEKSKQVAVDAPDITGHITVPTYFVVDEPDGTQKALHHVKDAEEISDVIRQARVDENGDRQWD
ncbi:MAG TPA: hypothetical protein V6C88_02335 [Chroococcidiopsis sp.]